MKTNKSKLKQYKKINLYQQQSSPSFHHGSTNKQISTHGKISTNCTINSINIINYTNNKKSKNKKSKINTHHVDVCEVNRGLATSKSTKKLKIPAIKMKQNDQIVSIDQQSYRQYCLIGDTFVPITKKQQKQSIQQLFSKTASTSTQFCNYKSPPKSCHFTQNYKLKLKKKSIRSNNYSSTKSLIQLSDKPQALSPSIQHQSNNKQQIIYNEMGIQYSQRKQLQFQQQSQLKNKRIQQSIQTSLSIINQQRKQQQKQNVSDILFKLEFTHLSNEKLFHNLSSHQKQHFSQLLQSVLEKLKPKSIPVLAPINFNNCQIEVKPEVEGKLKQQIEGKDIIVDDESLKHLIMMREFRQMNLIQVQEQIEKIEKIDVVNTSLLSVISMLCNMFCYIEMQQLDTFLFSIGRIYGLSFKQKYRRITRQLPLNHHNNHFKVLDQNMFQNFITQSNIQNFYQAIHAKAIFDAFNQFLEHYRPFYSGNGQPFPWLLRMFTNLSQYSIDEESLQIIFRRAKETIVQSCSILCGLHVENPYKTLQEDNPLAMKLIHNENKLISLWINQQKFQNDEIQLESTKVLNKIGQRVYQQLLVQLLMQISQTI